MLQLVFEGPTLAPAGPRGQLEVVFWVSVAASRYDTLKF